MFYSFLYGAIRHGRQKKITASQSYRLLCILQNNPSILSLRLFSATSNQHSFTVSYLINTCRLSPESALSASRFVNLKTPDNPDSVIAFFKDQGFSETQITRLISRQPRVLLSDAGKTLLPKLEFLRSKGLSRAGLTQILSDTPAILGCSLEKRIIPSYNVLLNVLKSDEKIFLAVKRYPRLLSCDLNAIMLPNVNILLDNGVPECNIVTTLCSLPFTLTRSPIQLKDMVEEAKKMGFNPSRPMFMVALFTISSVSKSTWEKKFEVLKRFGWSEELVFEAFRRYPSFISVSENRLMATMDFLVNKMGYQSSLLARSPRLLKMSLEKKIVPRILFAQDLLSKGVIKHVNLRALLDPSESKFIEKFVNRYEAKSSELLKLYQEKLNLSKILENELLQAAAFVDRSSNWKPGMEASAY